MTLAEKRAERMKHVTRMRQINDAANSRTFTPEETVEYTRIEAEVDALGLQITEEESRASRADRLRAIELGLAAVTPPVAPPTPTQAPGTPTPVADIRARPEYRDAFVAYLQGGALGLRQHIAEHRVDTLQVGLFKSGGALQAPQQFIAELVRAVDNDVFVRKYARKFLVEQAESLGVPTLDTDVADLDWTPELLTGNQGDITTGKRELRPHPLAKRIKVSKTLGRVSAIPMDALVRERLAYKAGITMENGYLNGPGNSQPLGIFTPSVDGVPTSQDISTGNTNTSPTFDGLMEAAAFLKPGHRRTARWVFHRNGIKLLRKLKDAQGQYLLNPAVTGGIPSTILDIPYDESEYCPAVFTTGQYVGALCNWNHYWIADAMAQLTIQYLGELYAETNTDGYIARMESDGMPVLAEAFVRVKLA